MKLLWKIAFWAAIVGVALRFILPSLSITIPQDIIKPIVVFIFFTLWAYAFYKVFKAKGILKKIWLLFLTIMFSALCGWLMYYFDHYAVNSDIKS